MKQYGRDWALHLTGDPFELLVIREGDNEYLFIGSKGTVRTQWDFRPGPVTILAYTDHVVLSWATADDDGDAEMMGHSVEVPNSEALGRYVELYHADAAINAIMASVDASGEQSNAMIAAIDARMGGM